MDVDLNITVLFTRWVHISSAIVIVGGAVFYRVVLATSLVDGLGADAGEKLRQAVNARWARLLHVCILLLVASGLFEFYLLAILPGIDPMPYHAVFTMKVAAALALLFIACAVAGKSGRLARMRQGRDKWMALALALALGGLIVLLSGMLGQVRASSASHADEVVGLSRLEADV